MRKGFISELIKGQTVESMGLDDNGNTAITFTNKSVLHIKAQFTMKYSKEECGVFMTLDDTNLVED